LNFLANAAQHIFQKHQTDFSKVCVVLPSRRACFYFKRHLADLNEQPFLSPDVMAIDDFVIEMAGLRIIDQTSLLFEVYDVFKGIDPQVKFDKFMTWASTLLTDFDAIDQSLTNPKPLFNFMSAARAISRWNLELASSNKPDFNTSSVTDKYFKLFENLFEVYHQLKERLIQKQSVYRGLAYRNLAENIEAKLLSSDRFEKYYFVGLNALSRSEHKIVTQLIKAKMAETLWDSDSYYMDNTEINAGRIMRGYRKDGRFGEWNWLENNLLTTTKKIRIFPCQNASLMAKVTGHLYDEMLLQDPDPETVIVLNDETMLNPLMHALSDNVTDFNITMGLTLKQSILYTFITSIFELQTNVAEFRKKETGEKIYIPKYSHRHITKLLKHPLVKRYELIHFEGNQLEGQTIYNPIAALLHAIDEQNKAFFSEEEILEFAPNDALLKCLFTRWNGKAKAAVACFYELINILRELFLDAVDAIETEYLYLFFTNLNRLNDTLAGREEVNLNSFRVFVNEMFRQTRIPFSGEPVAKLQMMSMLETRTLDFKRVVLLSMNEGTLPASKRQNSLIPFDAAIEFGLPIHTEQDAIMAYHFYRLLQRAEQIDILYLTQSRGVGSKEPSRFIMQLENDLSVRNQKIEISYPEVRFKEHRSLHSKDLEVVKSPEIIQQIKEHIAQKGIYATQFNDFVACSIKYYFSQIAQIQVDNELSEIIDKGSFGTWLHNVLEQIDLDYTAGGRKIEKSDVAQILEEMPARIQKEQENLFKTLSFEFGMNLILKNTAHKLLIDFWTNQRETAHFPMEIVGIEKKMSVGFQTQINGQAQFIKIAGRIDRIEVNNDKKMLTVVDYKTGKVSPEDIELKEGRNGKTIFEKLRSDDDFKIAKARQLWLYQYLMLKKMSLEKGLRIGNQSFSNDVYDVSAKIYSFRNLKKKIETHVEFEENESIEAFLKTSEEMFTDVVTEILDENKPFVRTNNTDNCKFCNFKGLCGRD
jgi:hypothetical protein